MLVALKPLLVSFWLGLIGACLLFSTSLSFMIGIRSSRDAVIGFGLMGFLLLVLSGLFMLLAILAQLEADCTCDAQSVAEEDSATAGDPSDSPAEG